MKFSKDNSNKYFVFRTITALIVILFTHLMLQTTQTDGLRMTDYF